MAGVEVLVVMAEGEGVEEEGDVVGAVVGNEWWVGRRVGRRE